MKNVVLGILLVAVMAIASVVTAESAGKALYVSKCAKCHGMTGDASKKSGGTELKGMSAEDALTKMKGYVDGSYGGPRKKIMTNLVKKFSDEELEQMSEYIGTLK